jgi:clan AA aspartic protease (TIGR02281 family)
LKHLLFFILLQFLLLTVSGQIILKMQKEGGVYTIPCKVNGKPLKFIFDTGASIVLISRSEAVSLFNKGLITNNDFYGITYLKDATGGISEGLKINIKSLQVGNITLANVEAVVSNSINASLLLGNSALSKIGKIIFDPSNSTLTILNKTVIGKSKVYDMFNDVLYNYSGLVDNFCGFRLLQYEDCVINELGESSLIEEKDDETKYVAYDVKNNGSDALLMFTLATLPYGVDEKQIVSIQLVGVSSNFSVRGISLGSPFSLIGQNFGMNYKITKVVNEFGGADLIEFNNYNIAFEVNEGKVRSIRVFYKEYSLPQNDQIANFKFLKNAITYLDTKSIIQLFAPDFEIDYGSNDGDYIRFENGFDKDKNLNKRLISFIENSKYGLKSLLKLKIQPQYKLRLTTNSGVLIVLDFKQQNGIREIVFKPYLNRYLIWEINR